MNITQAVTDFISDLFFSLKKMQLKNPWLGAYAAGLIGVGLLFAGVYFIYGACVSCRERSAFKELIGTVDLYHSARTGKEQAPEWSTIRGMFHDEYERHKNSGLAPYFLLFEANSALRSNEKDEARIIMNEAVRLAKNKPFAHLFALKSYLMMLDSNDEQVQLEAVEGMRELAADSSNIYADATLYYLGRYFLIAGRTEDARITWLELFDRYEIDQTSPSPWISQAYALFQQVE